jgi:hypothetical protein
MSLLSLSWASHSDQELLTLAGVSGDASECANRLFTFESNTQETETGPVLCDDQGLGCQFAESQTRNATMRRSLTRLGSNWRWRFLAVFRERPRYPQPLYIMLTKIVRFSPSRDSGAMGSSDNPACRPQCLQDQGSLGIQVRSGCRRYRHGIRVRLFLHHRPKDKDFGRELATRVEAESHNVHPCRVWPYKTEIRPSKRTSKKSKRLTADRRR